MDEDILTRIEAVLKEAGYTGFETRRASGTVTVTGRKGDTQFVVHFSERRNVPEGGQPNTTTLDASAVRVRAGLPGLTPEAIAAVLNARQAPAVIGVTANMAGGSSPRGG
jgi:hypothetical protein